MSLGEIKRRLTQFLGNMKSIKDTSFTHTSITSPAGSYYIQAEDMERFYKLYSDAFSSGCELYLTEKHREISPILIDFDFRFPVTDTERKYTLEHITKVIKRYVEEIHKYIEMNEDIMVYVLEKSKPFIIETKSLVKDGIHIVIPNVVTHTITQLQIRENVLKDIDDIFADIGSTNSIDDIFDKCVIDKNNWQMYGSTKPGCERYEVTHIFRVDSELELHVESLAQDNTEYIKLLSIRNKFVENKLRDDKFEEIQKRKQELLDVVEKKTKNKRLYSKIVQPHNNSSFTPSSEELTLVKQFVKLLSPERSNRYEDWIRVGWCLRNIDISLLEDWDDFSKNSAKYEVGACEKIWYRMREGGLGIGTLHMWVKHDNPDEYQKLIIEDLSGFIYKSLSGTDYDIAMVICRMFRHKYRCASHKHQVWYEYKNHRWHQIERGYTLFYKEIPQTLWQMYQKYINIESMKAAQTSEPNEQKVIQDNQNILTKIAGKLKNTSFVKDKMYKECSGMFYEPGFEEKLDSNPSLLCFENGVYDLENDEFREGRPEDYVHLSTGINYIEYDESNPYIEQIMDFMKKVLTIESVRTYVLTLFASMLDGSNRDEKFHIWTGSGSNGKSKIVELFQNAIGDYSCIFNVSLLTQKRVGSSATNSELAIAKGKRFGILQEPEENERLNVGLMKELTGGDKIQCRGLFKEPVKFKPMFKMILTCNHMPSIPPDDGGTWRRIRRVEFTSKFVDNPDPNTSTEFKIDRELPYKFEAWKETFMTILLRYYKDYKVSGSIVEPKEVMEYTNEYQRKNDIFADFCDNYIKKTKDAFMDMAELFEKFKEYCTVDNIKNKMIKKSVFQEAMEKRYGKINNVRGKKGWEGYNLIVVSRITEE